MPSYQVNLLIQTMCRNPETIARLNADPEAVFEQFGLSEAERAALRDGSVEAMGSAGAHPILQMHWLMARQPQIMEQMSILEYPNLIEE
jgi:2'-aminobiphenyl-2,3-diol 1,2-dioxygenase, small subunit